LVAEKSKGFQNDETRWQKGRGRTSKQGNGRYEGKISQLAREHTLTAFHTLVDVAENGQSDSARIAAATALLDRGFGKPRQTGNSSLVADYTRSR